LANDVLFGADVGITTTASDRHPKKVSLKIGPDVVIVSGNLKYSKYVAPTPTIL
jgi:hypothetical protein